jgi:hypothetical protein
MVVNTKAVKPTTGIKQTNYRELGFRPSLRAYTRQRFERLRVLRALTPSGWSRTALVTGAGKPRERTAGTYGQWLAKHEAYQVRQIDGIANTVPR